MVDTVGMAITLFPGGKPFAKLAQVFGKVARTETRLGTNARRLWQRLTGLKGKNTGPEIVQELEKAGAKQDLEVPAWRAREKAVYAERAAKPRYNEWPESVRNKFHESLREIDKDGLTQAGRKAQAHGDRPNDPFPRVKGNNEMKNARGRITAEEIVMHPESSSEAITTRRGRPYLEITHPDGRCVRCKMDGAFATFLTDKRCSSRVF